MTLIRPIKGGDDAMREAFASIPASDPGRTLQVVLALESEEDAAYPLAREFRDAHPDRDIEIVLSGPAGELMGKAHNMIAGLARAKHAEVLFSDADARLSPALLADAARAFAEGADAVYSLPYHAEADGIGGWWYMIAFNHNYSIPAALSWRLGQFRSFSGGCMGYTKAALARLGGIEPYAREIADDFALGAAARRAGMRQELLRVPVFVRETGAAPLEAYAHMAKWASIVFWTVPAAWLVAPLFSPTLLALAALALPGDAALPLAALAVATTARVLLAWLQDRRVGGYRKPLRAYWRLAFADLGGLSFWPLGLRRTIAWRGRRYRLYLGGRCEVVA